MRDALRRILLDDSSLSLQHTMASEFAGDMFVTRRPDIVVGIDVGQTCSVLLQTVTRLLLPALTSVLGCCIFHRT
jgi:N-formylglutamate amidohydrolase